MSLGKYKQRGAAHLSLLALIVVLAIGGILVYSLRNFTGDFRGRAAITPRTLNVIEIRYTYNSADSTTINNLSNQLKAEIAAASKYHGYQTGSQSQPVIGNVQIHQVLTRPAPRPAPDSGTPPGEEWENVYNKILTQNNICQLISQFNADQVWLWVDPTRDTGYGVEYAISGKSFSGTHINVNSTTPKTPFCNGNRTFIFMGFDYSTSVDFAMHSLGHTAEGLLGNLQTTDLFWERYTGGSSQISQQCGNIHFPPNGSPNTTCGLIAPPGSGYDYCNPAAVSSKCENWNPNGSGNAVSTSCTKWGCTQGGYMRWWFQNMPTKDLGFTYQGKPIPTWWDFFLDMDNTIKDYINQGYFVNPSFEGFYSPPEITAINKGNVEGVGSVIFSHTASGQNRFLLVSVSYRSPNQTANDRVNAITYLNQPLTKIRRDIYHEYVSELWYFPSSVVPDSGSVNVQFLGNPTNKVAAAYSFQNINPTTPLANTVGFTAGSSTYTGDPVPTLDNLDISINAQQNQLAFAALTTFTGSLENIVTRKEGNRLVLYGGDLNVIAQAVIKNTTSGSNTLGWTATYDWPWSISAIILNRAPGSPTPPPPTPTPSIAPTPTPSASPSPTPTSSPGTGPIVTLKVGGYDTTLYLVPGGSSTLNWTVTNAPTGTTCTASGGWSGTKALSGSQTTGVINADTSYKLTCTGPTGNGLDTVNVKVLETDYRTDLKINGSDGPLILSGNQTLNLSWQSSASMQSCKASVEWSGDKILNGFQTINTNVSYIKTYTLTCIGPWGSTRDSVMVAPAYSHDPKVELILNGGSDGPVTIKGGSNVLLSWTVAGGTATSCTASGGWTGAKTGTGSLVVNVPTGYRNYVISCNIRTPDGNTRTVSDTLAVNALPTTAIGSFVVAQGQPGFQAKYYKSTNLTDMRINRVESRILNEWGSTGSPDKNIFGTDNFSARWSTQFVPWKNGNHVFQTTSDDGVRVYVDGQLVINNWISHPRKVDQRTVSLVAGKPYKIVVEYYERNSNAVMNFNLGDPATNTQASGEFTAIE